MIFVDTGGSRWKATKRILYVASTLLAIPVLVFGASSIFYQPTWPSLNIDSTDTLKGRIEKVLHLALPAVGADSESNDDEQDEVPSTDEPRVAGAVETSDESATTENTEAADSEPAVLSGTPDPTPRSDLAATELDTPNDTLTVNTPEATDENAEETNTNPSIESDQLTITPDTTGPGNSDYGTNHQGANDPSTRGTADTTDDTSGDTTPDTTGPGNSDYGHSEKSTGSPDHSNKGGNKKN